MDSFFEAHGVMLDGKVAVLYDTIPRLKWWVGHLIATGIKDKNYA
jgi:hypothetical protein